MDDLKIYAESDQKLSELVRAVHQFSRDIVWSLIWINAPNALSGLGRR